MTDRIDLISLTSSKWRLATLWFTGFAILLFLMLGQTFGGFYPNEAEVKTVWNWFLPNIVPTLTLIIGVLAGDAQPSKKEKRMVNKKFYQFCFAISTLYLLILLAHIVIPPFFFPTKMIDLFGMSSIWLSVLQGFVAASMGVFFVRQEFVNSKS